MTEVSTRAVGTTYVSGASRGIGRLTSVALAADGAQVIGFPRQSTDLDSLRTGR